MAKLTKEQREAFIKKYGEKNLKTLELPLDENNTDSMDVVCVIPDRSVMGQFMKFIDINPKKAQDILLKQCLLTDKEVVLNDDALSMTAVAMIAELFPIRQGKIKKF